MVSCARYQLPDSLLLELWRSVRRRPSRLPTRQEQSVNLSSVWSTDCVTMTRGAGGGPAGGDLAIKNAEQAKSIWYGILDRSASRAAGRESGRYRYRYRYRSVVPS